MIVYNIREGNKKKGGFNKYDKKDSDKRSFWKIQLCN